MATSTIEKFLKEHCIKGIQRAYKTADKSPNSLRPSLKAIGDIGLLNYLNTLPLDSSSPYYSIFVELLDGLRCMDVDGIKGFQFQFKDEFGEKYKIASTEEQRVEILNKLFTEIPFLKQCPYTLSANTQLPHFYFYMYDELDYSNEVGVYKNDDFVIDFISKKKCMREVRNGIIYNVSFDEEGCIKLPVFNWFEISPYFNTEAMNIQDKDKPVIKGKGKKNIRFEELKFQDDEIRYLTNEKIIQVRNVIQRIEALNKDEFNFKNYDSWMRLGFMIYNEIGDEGLSLFDEISRKYEGYNEKGNKDFWKGIKNNNSNELTLRTYLYKLKKYGVYIEDVCCNINNYTEKQIAEMYFEIWAKENVKAIAKDQIYIYNENQKLWKLSSGSNEVMTYLSDKLQFIYLNSAKELTAKLLDENDKDKKKEIKTKIESITKSKQKLGTANYCKAVYYYLEPYITDKEFKFILNKKKDYLPLKNGKKICLRDGVISDRIKDDYFTFELDLDYIPNCDFTNVLKYVNPLFISKEVTGERPQFVKFIQTLLGYFLTGNINHRKIYVLFGIGSNGKSSLFNLIDRMMGKFYKVTTEDIIVADRSKKNNKAKTQPELFDLFDTRLVVVNELEEGEKINTKKMKAIRGGDKLAGRNLFSKDIEAFHTQAKLVILTNNKPEVDITDQANKDSMCIIPFNARFWETTPSQEEYLEFIKTDKRFLNEFFSWCVQGSINSYTEVHKAMDEPEEVKCEYNVYIDENDVIKNYIEENYTIISREDWNIEYEKFKKTKGREEGKYKLKTFAKFYTEFKSFCFGKDISMTKSKLQATIESKYSLVFNSTSKQSFIPCIVDKVKTDDF